MPGCLPAQTARPYIGVMFGPENRGEWRYDAATGNYLRWIEEERSGNKIRPGSPGRPQ